MKKGVIGYFIYGGGCPPQGAPRLEEDRWRKGRDGGKIDEERERRSVAWLEKWRPR